MFISICRREIEVIGIASDGDSRLLSSMKCRISFLEDVNEELLAARLADCPEDMLLYVQDTIHIGTKLRNRLLKLSGLLPMGDQLVSITHIKTLLTMVSKEIHGLVRSDILPQDRQNYASLEKLMEDRVLNTLKEHVIGSDATQMYLFLCKQITSSYLDEKITPTERIYRIWHALFFLRAWKLWIQSSQNAYRVRENFISSNALNCIEINANAIIFAILKFRTKPDLFLPGMFSSQPCENTFRLMRSMGTANFTKINFTLYELLHMVARIGLMNDIAYKNCATADIIFPRLSIAVENENQCELPTVDEIVKTIHRALDDALDNAARFKLNPKITDIMKCTVLRSRIDLNLSDDESDTDKDSDGEWSDELESNQSNPVNFDKNVEIVNPDGTTKIIRKSTLVWILTENKSKLSSDRLKRVQSSNADVNPQKPKKKAANIPDCSESVQALVKLDEIMIGDWCFFQMPLNQALNDQHVGELPSKNVFGRNVLGEIVAFRNVNAKNERERNCSLDVISLSNNNENAHKIEALATWYTCDENKILYPFKPTSHFFIGLKSYIAKANISIIKHEINQEINLVLNCNIPELKNAYPFIFN